MSPIGPIGRILFSRRSFLSAGASGLAALLGLRVRPSLAAEGGIKSFRTLGRTGVKVSDVSLGTYGVTQQEVVAAALDAGVNFIDTGPTYGEAEVVVGQALKQRKREDIIVATRWYNNNEPSALNLLKQLDKSLGRLQTDYVDVIIVGGAETVDQLKNRSLHEAFAAAQKQKKVRFMGVAGHGKQLTAIMRQAIQSDKFDLVMPAYNFMKAPGLEKEIADAHKKGVAVVAMKTLAGARAAKVEGFGGDRTQQVRSAIAWALKDAGVSSVVITMKSFEDVKECVGASGAKFGAREAETLRRYAQAHGSDYCRPGCSECCKNYSGPVRVQDIFRFQMYSEKYGLKELAAREYASLAAHEQAGNETLLFGLGECPFGIDVKRKLARADKTLWLA